MSLPGSVRARTDACPGALTLHPAADGLLARIRLPGGRLSAGQLRALGALAAEHGDGALELTSRGNVQLRGLTAAAGVALERSITDAGLLPAPGHERVRNVVADLLGGAAVDQVVADLDAGLCARARLADLSGRFLFAVSTPERATSVAADADVTLLVDSVPERGRPAASVIAGGHVARLEPGEAVDTALDVAEAYLDARGTDEIWRIGELTDGGAGLLESAGRRGEPLAGPLVRGPEPVGPVELDDGARALVVLVPLARLEQRQIGFLTGTAGPRGLRVTPWHSVALLDVDAISDPAVGRAAAAAGLPIDAASPWYRLSTCAGRPGCAKSHADVRADARAAAAAEGTPSALEPGQRVRWSGCERRCGRPAATEVDLIATAAGYRIERAGAPGG